MSKIFHHQWTGMVLQPPKNSRLWPMINNIYLISWPHTTHASKEYVSNVQQVRRMMRKRRKRGGEECDKHTNSKFTNDAFFGCWRMLKFVNFITSMMCHDCRQGSIASKWNFAFLPSISHTIAHIISKKWLFSWRRERETVLSALSAERCWFVDNFN